MTWTENREEVKFVVFGKSKVKPGQEANSFVVEENQYIEGLVLKITDSPVYKKVFKLQVKGETAPVVVTGKTGLNEQAGYGEKVVPHIVKEGDVVRITYLGMQKTSKGKEAYKLKLEIDL